MKQLTEEQQDALMDECIDNFDFEKVHKVMVMLQWKWVEKDGSTLSIPDIPRMKAAARRSLRAAYRYWKTHEGNHAVVGSGGFEACYATPEGDNGHAFYLRFVLAEAEAELEKA
jgi:hypothetical protein